MHRLLALGVLLLGVRLVGCGPTVTVRNNTGFPVRALILSSGARNVLSPSPGESSYAEVTEGRYSVTVIPDAEWISYAKNVRAYLNEQIANSDRLSGAQLLEVVRRLKDIAERMKQYEATSGKGATCSGSVTQDRNAIASVSSAADGSLSVVCR